MAPVRFRQWRSRGENMTERIAGFTVALDGDYREDDIKGLKDAIGEFKQVTGVTPVVSDPALYVARVQARHALEEQIADVIWPDR